MELIQVIKNTWSFNDLKHIKDYPVWGDRIVSLYHTDQGPYILKGLPLSTEPSLLANNLRAQEALSDHDLAPEIIKTNQGQLYIKTDHHYLFLMAYLDGENLQANGEDEYKLGQATRRLHSQVVIDHASNLYSLDRLNTYKSWFEDQAFKPAYDVILEDLPDFNQTQQAFIHTDIGPHNAKFNSQGQVYFIDLDDAGMGPLYLDLGWPFIMQFVDYNKANGQMTYQLEAALGFLRGYYMDQAIPEDQYKLIWQGATYMHVSYMKTYGPEAVEALWKILQYGLDQKDLVFRAYHQAIKL